MKQIKTYLLLIALSFSSVVHAATYLDSDGPTVGDTNDFFNRVPLLNNYLDREDYESAGIIYQIKQDFTHQAEHGESWTMSLIENATGQVVGIPIKYVALTSEIDYDNPVCIFLEWNGVVDPNEPRRQCFSKDKVWFPVPEIAYIGLNWKMSCEEPGAYTVTIEHHLGTREDDFELSEFVPGKPVVSGVTEITPLIASSRNSVSKIHTGGFSAGRQTIDIDVIDNKGCNIKIPDIEVELVNTIVVESGDHDHFDEEGLRGTGKYIESTPSWNSIKDENTAIKVKSDSNGHIKAIYEAGIYGVDEMLTVKVHVPDTGAIVEKETEFSIKVPGLVRVAEDGTFDFSGYDNASACDQNHNESTTVRSGVYVTPTTYFMLSFLNIKWQELEGAKKLCLNDGSLENGGFFDQGTDRTTQCHSSHRMGIDVDITMAAAACSENLFSGEIIINGVTVNKADEFWRLANRLGAYKPPSDHVRFWR